MEEANRGGVLTPSKMRKRNKASAEAGEGGRKVLGDRVNGTALLEGDTSGG